MAYYVLRRSLTCDPYKSRDTYGNFLRLVRPTGPCRDKLVSIRRTRLCEPALGRSRDTCGNFLRPVRLARPCFRRHAAIARIVRHLDRRIADKQTLVEEIRRMGARPQCQPRQGQLALLNPQCPYQTQAPLPCNLNESGD